VRRARRFEKDCYNSPPEAISTYEQFVEPHRTSIQQGFSKDFHRRNFDIAQTSIAPNQLQSCGKSRESAVSAGFGRYAQFTIAPIALHAPVNELHSIEIKAFTFLFFRLTRNLEGVKHNCSLTVTEFFRLVQRPGVKRDHPSQTARVLTR
jgi:hypothetical protein